MKTEEHAEPTLRRAGRVAREAGEITEWDSVVETEVSHPHGWQIRRLRELIKRMDAGVSVNSEDRSAEKGECGVLKTSAVTSGIFEARENKVILGSELKRAKISPIRDCIIMSRMNTVGLVGANAYIPRTMSNLFLPDRLWLLTAKEGQVHMRWLAYVLGSPAYRSKLSSFATGTSDSMKNITKEDVGSLSLLLPPMPEQKAIADLLSAWDEAIEQTEQLIRAKNVSLRALVQTTLGRRAAISAGWPAVPIGSLFSEVSRKARNQRLTPYSISAGAGFVSQMEKWGKDISGSQYENYTHLKAGEFAYNKGNSKSYPQGCAYLLKQGEICVPNVFICFKPKTQAVVPEFFEQYFIAGFHSQELKRYITSGARSDGLLNLNKQDFFRISVPCPPPETQRELAEAITSLQAEIDLLRHMARNYKFQKRGLMQKLLTGEWRVSQEMLTNSVKLNPDQGKEASCR